MSEARQLVVVISRGFDDERSSVAWSVANGGIASGLDVTVFLVASGVDWVRRGAAEPARLNPLDPPMNDMIQNFMGNGGKVIACPPCAKVRGYTPDHLLQDVVIAGSPSIHALIKEGAATLSF